MTQGFVNGTTSAYPDKICQGRVTAATGQAVPTSNVTAATTLYFTPFRGNQIDLYTASQWQRFTFSELSIAVPATTSQMYDVWIYNNSGVAAIELLAWTNDTTRATNLTTQDGVYVKNGDATRRYVGSFRTTTVSGQTEDSNTSRFVYNYYNRVKRNMSTQELTNSWTYSSSTFRIANGSTANQLQFVIGVTEDMISASVIAMCQGNSTGTGGLVGVGYNSTTVNSAQSIIAYPQVAGTGTSTAVSQYNNNSPSVGYSYMAWIESNVSNANTLTWYGDNNVTGADAGIGGYLFG